MSAHFWDEVRRLITAVAEAHWQHDERMSTLRGDALIHGPMNDFYDGACALFASVGAERNVDLRRRHLVCRVGNFTRDHQLRLMVTEPSMQCVPLMTVDVRYRKRITAADMLSVGVYR